jgi:hypothetical protein
MWAEGLNNEQHVSGVMGTYDWKVERSNRGAIGVRIQEDLGYNENNDVCNMHTLLNLAQTCLLISQEFTRSHASTRCYYYF